MAKPILFDLDGTLVDHRGAVATAIAGLARRFAGPAAPEADLVHRWRELEHRHMAEYLARQCSFAEQRRRRLRSFLPYLGEPVPNDDAGLDAWFAGHYLPAYEAAWRAYPDVLPCLTGLRALPSTAKLAVLTNGDREQQQAKLRRCGLLDHFDMVLTPTELGAAKPDPASFTSACRHLDANAAEVTYVGDWLEGDAIAASYAGLRGVWLDRGTHPMTGEPTSPDDAEAAAITRITNLADLAADPS